MLRIEIDGEVKECVRTGRKSHGFEDVMIMGKTLSGRTAPVACHRMPVHMLDNGGGCYTGGHHYMVKSNACA